MCVVQLLRRVTTPRASCYNKKELLAGSFPRFRRELCNLTMNQSELQPAIDFVLLRGTPVEQARLRAVLYGDAPPDDVRDQLQRSQRSDGGWAANWAPDYSSLDATCYQLSQAEQLGIGRTAPMVIDAVRFLAERQHFDGSWAEEPSEAAAAPVWATPGDAAAGLYVTANCAFWVAMTGLVPSAVHDAALYLSFHLDESGALPSFSQTHWLAAAVWQHQGMADEARKSLRYLNGIVPELSAGNLAWMVMALRLGGVRRDNTTVRAALDRLIKLRDDAVSWPADEGADNSVHVTIEAIRALKLCRRLS